MRFPGSPKALESYRCKWLPFSPSQKDHIAIISTLDDCLPLCPRVDSNTLGPLISTPPRAFHPSIHLDASDSEDSESQTYMWCLEHISLFFFLFLNPFHYRNVCTTLGVWNRYTIKHLLIRKHEEMYLKQFWCIWKYLLLKMKTNVHTNEMVGSTYFYTDN